MCNTCGCRAAEEINPVDSVIVEAPLGRGVAQFYAEGGDMATYSPSQEPDMTSPATEPTNANFSAESKSMFGKDKNGKMYARRRNGRIITHNAESFGAEYDERFNIGKCDWAEDCKCEDEDVHCSKCNYNLTTSGGRECPNGCFDEKGAESDVECITCASDMSDQPLWGCECCGMLVGTKGDHEGCGFNEDGEVMCNLCYSGQCDCESFSAESKSMFGKDKNGKMYARRRNGRIITHNAEHEGLYACSKCKHWNRNPVDGITKCKKCGNGTFTFVKRSEFMPEGDGNVVGQQTFTYNGTPLRAEEETSFGLVGEGNDFGQMRAEEGDLYYCSKCDEGFSSINPTDEGQFCDSCLPSSATLHDEMERITMDADYALEKPFQTGAKLSAGLLTGAALFGLVGASLTTLLGSIMERGE